MVDREQHIKYLIGLVYIGLAFAAIVLVVDYQMKQQILRESLTVRSRIKILDEVERHLHYDAADIVPSGFAGNDGTSDIDSLNDGSTVEAAGHIRIVDSEAGDGYNE